MPCRTHSGFSLIELVFVIVLLTILGVLAAPRFIDIATDGHRSSVAGSAASFQEAVILVRATSIAKGLRGPRNNIPDFGDGTVDINSNGFPVDTVLTGATLYNNTLTTTRCMAVWNGILQNPPTITTSTSTAFDYRVTVNNGAVKTCTYTYRRSTSPTRSFTYSTITGRVTVVNP